MVSKIHLTTDAESILVPEGEHTTLQRVTGFEKVIVDFKFLLLEQLLEIRSTWYWHMAFALVLPMAFVFGFGRIGGGEASVDRILYIISGSAVFSIANDGLFVMASRIGIMRRDGVLIYYASLPMSQSAFLMAMMLSRLLITLPGMIVPILFGQWLYDAPIVFSPWILILFPLVALAMSSMGLMLGVLIENLEILQVITNILMFIIVMATPVFIPVDSLPLPLQIFSFFIPPTYAAEAMRATLVGGIDTVFFFNLCMLIIMTLIGFVVVNRFMRLRVT